GHSPSRLVQSSHPARARVCPPRAESRGSATSRCTNGRYSFCTALASLTQPSTSRLRMIFLEMMCECRPEFRHSFLRASILGKRKRLAAQGAVEGQRLTLARTPDDEMTLDISHTRRRPAAQGQT